jgi:hypothetical protein
MNQNTKREPFDFAWGQVSAEVKEVNLDTISNEDFTLLYFPTGKRPNVSVERSKKILVEEAYTGNISNISKRDLAAWTEKELVFDDTPLTPIIIGDVLKAYLTFTRAQLILKAAMSCGLRRTGKQIMEDTFGRTSVIGVDGEPLLKEKPERGFKVKEQIIDLSGVTFK